MQLRQTMESSGFEMAETLEVLTALRTAKLDILERQKSPSGEVIWLRAGKAPIVGAAGRAIGVFGMSETVDDKEAKKIFFAKTGQAATQTFKVPKPEKGQVLGAFAAHKDEVTAGYTAAKRG